MGQVQEFSTSPTCRNGFDIGVMDGSVSYVRRFWSYGANQRVYEVNPTKGGESLTSEIVKEAMQQIISNGSPQDIRNLYGFLNKEGKALMEDARIELIRHIDNLF